MRKALLIFLLSVAYLIYANKIGTAQHLGSRTELFSIENGLSQTGINHILRDSKGFLWLATQDGLDRYDGNNFQVFRHQPADSNSICDNYIRDIWEDHNFNLWIATNNGLSKYDPRNGTFKNYFNDPSDAGSIADNSIYAVFEDRDGIIWVKTLESLEKFDAQKNKFIHYFHFNNVFNYISGDFYFAIHEDKNGKLWVGTKDGLNCFDKNLELFERFEFKPNDPRSISDNRIKAICEDKAGNLWIGTEKGLNLFNKRNKDFTRYYKIQGNSNSLTDNTINDIYDDNNGLIWISLQSGFCSLNYRTKQFTQYPYINLNSVKLELTGVSSIIKDSADLLWIGCYQGLIKIDLKPFKFKLYRQYSENTNDLSGINVSSLYCDNKENIWIGTWGDGLTVSNRTINLKTHYTVETHPQVIKDNNVFVIYPDRNDKIWIGTGSGISIFDTKNNQFTNICKVNRECSFLENNRVYSIYEDKRGLYWIGTEHGLHTFNYKTNEIKNYIQIPDSQGIIMNSVYCITEDTLGNIWFGTNKGLVRYNPENGQYKSYEANKKVNINSLSSNAVYSIYYSSKHVLWIGTTSGLCQYKQNNDNFTIYTEKDGLPNNLIYAILEDKFEHLWLSTNRGLVQFDPILESFTGYDLADGLQSYEFNIASAFKSNKGELFFGGINGYNSFYPESLNTSTAKPNIEITSIEIIGRGLKQKLPVWPEKTIRIPANTSMFVISFAVLDFTFPESNQYMYMISSKGKEGLWINNGNRNYASFSNLPAGVYAFRVKGANSDMVWSENDYAVNIVVESPFWTTNTAVFLYVLVLVSLGYGAVQWRTRKLRHTNKILMDKELAAQEITRQKEELTIKNKNITDSINYAKRIQVAMMPTEKTFKRIIPNSFVLHKPRDIVSGDFYWIYERNDKVFVAAVDCTGHGVPGAFMSILGVELFRKITQGNIENPGHILSRLNEDFSRIFSDIEDISLKDGMDISFCVIDKSNYTLEFAGAFNPLYLIRENKIIETKGNRFSVSMEKKQEALLFETHNISIQKGDMLYIFSDGYADQFGGYEGKKFKYRRFRHLLLNIHNLPLEKQKSYLEESMEAWKGNQEQVDDILVIGIKADF